MRVSLGYGKRELTLDFPPHLWVQVLRPRPLEAIPAEAALQAALDAPIEAPPLREIVAAKRVAIIVPDITRTVRSEVLVPALVDYLTAAGVREERLVIIVAPGTHRLTTPEEAERIVSPRVISRIACRVHDANDAENCLVVGVTKRGTKVALNRWAMEADLRVVLGGVIFHYFAGYGGGRKMIVPGIAAAETVQHNHKLMMHPEGGVLPTCTAGVLEGNPLHEDMVEGAGMAEPVFAINVVLNHRREVGALFCGGLVASHAAAREVVDACFRIPLPDRSPLVVASAGGFPKDITFIQGHKAIEHSFPAVAAGGNLLATVECPEGMGANGFLDYACLGSPEAIEAALRQRFAVVGHTAYAMLEKSACARITMLTALPEEHVRLCGAHRTDDAQAALNEAASGLNEGTPVYVFPEGNVTLPVLESAG